MSLEYKAVDCMVHKSMYLGYKVMVPSIQENVRRIQSCGLHGPQEYVPRIQSHGPKYTREYP